MSIVEHRRRMERLLAEGTKLRNEALFLVHDDDCREWKERAPGFFDQVYDTVAAIDEGDLYHVRTLGQIDGPIGRREMVGPSPLIDDPSKLLPCLDTLLVRMRDVMGWHTERFGPIRGRRKVQSRGYREQDMPLLQEMHEAIRNQRISVPAAADLVADRAPGGGTMISRRKRLERLYIKEYSG